MTQKFLRVIGDVHGAINTPHPHRIFNYVELTQQAPYSVQLGDMGFNYIGLKDIDPFCHVFIPGNHDNYDDLPCTTLGDYGICYMGPNTIDDGENYFGNPWGFYYVRGEWSIDILMRKEAMARGSLKCWWEEEELTARQMEDCLNYYKECKPDVVMTHTCPRSIAELIGNPGVWHWFGHREPRPSNTQHLLQYMYEAHQPKLWLFGHFHKNWIYEEGKTTFMCVNELDFVDFNENWEII